MVWAVCLFTLCIGSCKLRNSDGRPLHFGIVSAASPEAAEVGMDVLRNGGNAVDAAVAMSFVLNITEPAMSGLGGGTQVLLYNPGEQPISINGSTLSPASTPRAIRQKDMNDYQRTTIPSTVKVMQYLYDHYGSGKLSWTNLLEKAMVYTHDGFTLGHYRYKVYEEYREKLEAGLPATQRYLVDSTKHAGSNPALKSALQLIAVAGADAFYSGSIARAIAEDMVDNEGWITIDDLMKFPWPSESEPIHFTYRGFDVYTQPDPCGGPTVKEILTFLEELRERSPETDFRIHLALAIRHGHAKREKEAKEGWRETGQGETTHFSVMDADGMAISVTSSINAYYGSGAAQPLYGFLYNSYMDDFVFGDSLNRFAIGPGKMAYSSMSPTLVMKDGRTELVLGSPGSGRIISTVAQLIALYCEGSTDPMHLHKLPRIHAMDTILWVETDAQAAWYDSVLGHEFDVRKRPARFNINELNPYFGGVHMIVRTNDGYRGLADVRRDGVAITN